MYVFENVAHVNTIITKIIAPKLHTHRSLYLLAASLISLSIRRDAPVYHASVVTNEGTSVKHLKQSLEGKS